MFSLLADGLFKFSVGEIGFELSTDIDFSPGKKYNKAMKNQCDFHHSCNDYNFSSITCEKSAFSLTISIKNNPYSISRKNSLELIELSSINKVSLV
jgi:hypothetical protein